MTPEDLIAFEAEVAEYFNSGSIKGPVHLSGGNEKELISYFEYKFRPGDWVCSSWRSHYHALMTGVPREKVMSAILAGKSITLCWPEHRFITSAIVGGILPIAVGLAMGIRRSSGSEIVHVFLGDMTAKGGAYHEAYNYAAGLSLPISFVVEDNGMSVGTPTAEVWREPCSVPRGSPYLEHHNHKNPWPHSGAGKFINF